MVVEIWRPKSEGEEERMRRRMDRERQSRAHNLLKWGRYRQGIMGAHVHTITDTDKFLRGMTHTSTQTQINWGEDPHPYTDGGPVDKDYISKGLLLM